MHQPLGRLVHVSFTQLEQLFELAIYLFTVVYAIQHIGLLHILRLHAAVS